MNATLAAKWSNDLYCAEAFPARLYKRMRILEGIRDKELELCPSWVTNNRLGNRLTGLSERGEFYLKILMTAFDKKMHDLGRPAPMYFAGTKEEQQNPDANAYMRPVYNDVALMEDVSDESFGIYLNPLGDYFDIKWVKHDEEGYFRK